MQNQSYIYPNSDDLVESLMTSKCSIAKLSRTAMMLTTSTNDILFNTVMNSHLKMYLIAMNSTLICITSVDNQ